MSKRTDSSVASVGHAGHSAGALIEGAMRRILVVATLAVGAVLLVASVAFGCTVYWGQITIENLSDSNTGEFSVVADPTSGMDRCDDAMDGASSNPLTPDNAGDNVRVEISMWEPGDQDSGNSCEHDADGTGDADNDGNPDHSLVSPDATDDEGAEDVYINTYDGNAYEDKDGDGVYEDNDDAQGPFENASNETNGEVSSERIGNCMGDGSDSDVINHDPNDDGTSAIGVTSEGQFDGTNKDVTHNGSADQDSDGVNDVDITIDTAPATSGTKYAGAICVSEADEDDSAPQVPIDIT